MIYGLAGYTMQENGDPTVTAPGLSFSASIPELRGWTLGAGVETNLTANLVLRGEYDYIRFDDAALTLQTIGGTNLNNFADLTDRVTDQAFHVDLAYRWSLGEPRPSTPLK
jgi:opacity protein-like surface antigen